MASFMIRNLDVKLWQRVKANIADAGYKATGTTLMILIETLLAEWLDRGGFQKEGK